MLVKVICDWSESFQIQYHCRIWRMIKYRAIPSWEIARSLLIIYGRFDRNSLCWRTARRIGKPERTCTIITAPFSAPDSIFCRLHPIVVLQLSANFRLYAHCCISFLVRFFELVNGHFHSAGLFVRKELQQGRCLIYWVADSSHLPVIPRKSSWLIA